MVAGHAALWFLAVDILAEAHHFALGVAPGLPWEKVSVWLAVVVVTIVLVMAFVGMLIVMVMLVIVVIAVMVPAAMMLIIIMMVVVATVVTRVLMVVPALMTTSLMVVFAMMTSPLVMVFVMLVIMMAPALVVFLLVAVVVVASLMVALMIIIVIVSALMAMFMVLVMIPLVIMAVMMTLMTLVMTLIVMLMIGLVVVLLAMVLYSLTLYITSRGALKLAVGVVGQDLENGALFAPLVVLLLLLLPVFIRARLGFGAGWRMDQPNGGVTLVGAMVVLEVLLLGWLPVSLGPLMLLMMRMMVVLSLVASWSFMSFRWLTKVAPMWLPASVGMGSIISPGWYIHGDGLRLWMSAIGLLPVVTVALMWIAVEIIVRPRPGLRAVLRLGRGTRAVAAPGLFARRRPGVMGVLVPRTRFGFFVSGGTPRWILLVVFMMPIARRFDLPVGPVWPLAGPWCLFALARPVRVADLARTVRIVASVMVGMGRVLGDAWTGVIEGCRITIGNSRGALGEVGRGGRDA